jgi:CHAT domain-containing protein/Tfp pilus assembly protein PilF
LPDAAEGDYGIDHRKGQMTKGPGPGNLIRLSNAQTTLQSNHSGDKRSWHSHGNPLPLIVAIFVLATSSVFAQSAPSATGRKPHHEQLVLPGVVVEKVEKGSAAEEAGLRKGDVILSWSRGQDGGPVESPFDVEVLSLHQKYFGDVLVSGIRGSDPQSFSLGLKESTGLSVIPRFSISMLHTYRSCERLRDSLPLNSTICFKKAANWAQEHGDVVAFAWLAMRAADVSGQSRPWQSADRIYEQIIKRSDSLGAVVMTRVLLDRYLLLTKHQQFSRATENLYRALEASKQFGENNILSVIALTNLVRSLWFENDLVRAEQCARRALSQSESMSPGSAAVAMSAYYLGSVLLARSQLAAAEKYFRKASELGEKRKSIYRSFALSELGTLEWRRGDLTESDEDLAKAIQIMIKEAPTSDRIALTYDWLSNVARDRGNLKEAEHYLLEALAFLRKNHQKEMKGAFLNDLAFIALLRGEVVNSEQLFRRALVLQRQYEPGSTDFANTLMGLGMTLATQGKFTTAESYLNKSLAIQHRLAPGSKEIARIFNIFGDIAKQRGELEKAESLYQDAFISFKKSSPESVFMVQTLSRLAKVTALRGALPEAENLYLQALTMIEKLAPESTQAAEVLESLADLKREQGQIDAAVGYYERALKSLEGQTTMLGGSSDVVAGFRAQHQEFYRRYAELLAQAGQTEAAFAVVERSRARTLLETLARGEVDVSKGADPALLKKEKSLQADLRGKSERRIHLLAEKNTDDQLKDIEKQISDLTSEYQGVESQIRASSPAYAALTQPQPLTAKEIQTQLLDQDTLLLEYSLGEDRSHVFAVTPDSLQAFELPRRVDIEKQARLVYQLLTDRNHPVKGESEAQRDKRWVESAKAYDAASAELTRIVLAPVAAQMKSKRLVIVADGALNYVPFAALPEPAALAGTAPQPLTVNHEIVSLPSASVLGVLRQQYKDRKPAPNAVAVLADPVFEKNDPRVSASLPHDSSSVARASQIAKEPIEKQIAAKAGTKKRAAGKSKSSDDIDALLSVPLSASLLTRSASDLGFDRNGKLSLPRLRYTREEADAIYAVTPAAKGLEATDFRANRSTATSPDLANYRIIHFATHGLLNSQHPELSGLVFSLVDKNGNAQDGFLTLQDIYNLNLPADLVVLSACETGLGKEISGEGLIGLTRGFMYAGASRVVASLWNVSDVATAQLMAEFYRSMEKDGLPPAAALRVAQIKMLQQKRWASPYYWAAFQLQGEWK